MVIIRDNGTGAFILVSADETRELSLRVADLLAADFRQQLEEQGFHLRESDARSVIAEAAVAVATNPAAWTGMGGIIVAFLRRHRGKVHRFEIEGKTVSIVGYSAQDAKMLAAEILDLSRERSELGKTSGTGPGTQS